MVLGIFLYRHFQIVSKRLPHIYYERVNTQIILLEPVDWIPALCMIFTVSISTEYPWFLKNPNREGTSLSFKKGLLFFIVNPFGFLTKAWMQLSTGCNTEGKVVNGDREGTFTLLTKVPMGPAGALSTVKMF